MIAATIGSGASAHASPLAALHGIGASAVADLPGVLDSNPALLTSHARPLVWSVLRADTRPRGLRAEGILPTLQGVSWGVGLEQHGFDADASRRQRAALGLGHILHPRLSLGTSIDLWHGSGVRDFAPHVGLWFDAGRAGAASRRSLGLVGRNLVEPLRHPEWDDVGKRALDLAASTQHVLSPVWMLTTSAGLRVERDTRRAASVAAVLRWKERLECGIGVERAEPRLALGWRQRHWSVSWTWNRRAGSDAQELAIGWTWGPSLQERRSAQDRALRQRVHGQVEAAVHAFEKDQVSKWKSAGLESHERGDLDRAVSYYGMVLTTTPHDKEAQEGFRRSRHARFVAEADTLMQRDDYGGAARALEEALQIVPSDSTIAVRLREVRRAARLAFRQQSDAEQMFRTGIDAFATQRYPQAISDFRGVLALDPEHHMARSYLAQAELAHRKQLESTLDNASQRLQAQDFEAARRIVKRLLAEEPDQARALALLARIDDREARARRQEQRRAELAAAAAETRNAAPEDAAPTPPSAQVIERYEEGIRLYRTGDMVAAMQAWEEVAAQAPHHQDVDGYLLRVYRVAGLERYTEGRLQEAVDIWLKALQLDPENRQLSRYLNQAQTKLKRAHRAGGDE